MLNLCSQHCSLAAFIQNYSCREARRIQQSDNIRTVISKTSLWMPILLLFFHCIFHYQEQQQAWIGFLSRSLEKERPVKPLQISFLHFSKAKAVTGFWDQISIKSPLPAWAIAVPFLSQPQSWIWEGSKGSLPHEANKLTLPSVPPFQAWHLSCHVLIVLFWMWTLFLGQQCLPKVHHKKNHFLSLCCMDLESVFLENWYFQIIPHRQEMLLSSVWSLEVLLHLEML